MNICQDFRPDGGDDGIRTHDPLLAGQVLSQLSYTPKGCSFLHRLLFYAFCRCSRPRFRLRFTRRCFAVRLRSEWHGLHPHSAFYILHYELRSFASLVGPSGLEPPTSCLSGTRSNLLSYDPSSRLVKCFLFHLAWWRWCGFKVSLSDNFEPYALCAGILFIASFPVSGR